MKRASPSLLAAAMPATLVAFAGMFFAACQAAAPAPAPVTVAPVATVQSADTVRLGVPGRANQHVSMAADGAFVVAAWAASDEAGVTDIYAATSTNEGAGFSAPVRVNAEAGDARANGEQPPRVTLMHRDGAPPEIVVFWLARRATGTVLLTARSVDGGTAYGPSVLMPGTDTSGNRGWHAIAADPSGVVHSAWLDHRRLAPAAAGTAPHQHHGAAAVTPATNAVDTVAMAQLSDLYFAGGAQQTTPRPLTSGVCYCCKTAMEHGPDGTIYLAWRHVYPGNMRDIAFTMSRDGGRTFSEPIRVSADGWSIAGCPDDGPSMTVDARGRVHIVWPTVVVANGDETKSLFHAMTVDGQTFSPRVRIPFDEDAHHPQVVAQADGSIAVVWDAFVGEQQHVFRARGQIEASGAMAFDRRITSSSSPGRYPIAVVTPAHEVTAFVSGRALETVVIVERTTRP